MSYINQKCQLDTEYTGLQPNFYGGGVTGFAHYSGNTGALEYNPHNFAHNAIGGQDPTTGFGGLMGDPETAGLDPIFYLHHCNIDRMSAAWNEAGNSDPSDANWLDGQTATGSRKFYMPKPDKTAWEYTPAMVTDTKLLDYTYEDLSLGMATPSVSKKTLRLRTFGLAVNENLINNMKPDEQSELVGANKNAITLDATGARTTVKLDSSGWSTVSKKLTNAFSAGLTANPVLGSLPDEVYLQLEGIKGKEDSIVCSVSVNNVYAGHLSLFGLRSASKPDGPAWWRRTHRQFRHY
ncbi:tyrosinase family protein [Flavobacterium sp. 3HN19-14]|uniref:tyrosinase family protein n=1 Tax=Flavobacterium sp. 3HN19-14 TaxID=3448133 RepID=UPI003EE2581F